MKRLETIFVTLCHQHVLLKPPLRTTGDGINSGTLFRSAVSPANVHQDFALHDKSIAPSTTKCFPFNVEKVRATLVLSMLILQASVRPHVTLRDESIAPSTTERFPFNIEGARGPPLHSQC